MNIRKVKEYTPGKRIQKIKSCLIYIQHTMTRLSTPGDVYFNLLKNAYKSIKEWEQETPDAQETLALARDQANATGSQTLPIIIETIVGKFSSEQTNSLLSVGYGTAKKEEQISVYLRTKYNRDVAIIGVERDYGLSQKLPHFLSQEPNRSILLNQEDERPYFQAVNVDSTRSIGLMILSAHHTLLDLPVLFRKFQGLNGLILVEELTTDEQWADPKYRAWRAVIEVFFNYAFLTEMPEGFDFETQFDAKYYTKEDVLKKKGIIIDIPNTQIPPISLVLFTKEVLG